MLRDFSQWPNKMFKIPDLLQWIVVATEPSIIEEIRKAPEDVLSAMDALEEVSTEQFLLGLSLFNQLKDSS